MKDNKTQKGRLNSTLFSLPFSNISMMSFCLLLVGLLMSCQEKKKQWKFQENISIEGITPIGIAQSGKHFWLSDGDHNRLVHVNKAGKILTEEKDIERPMHLAIDGEKILVPSYGSDDIIQIYKGDKKALSLGLTDSLDAPASVAIWNQANEQQEMAIADFYNHRVLFTTGGPNPSWISIGEKGKTNGKFHYPTDVQITEDKIFVADAYNHRVQVFDKSGQHLQTIGKEQKMNAATGIFINDQSIFVTDFENDRILEFNHQGEVQQILEEGLDKPTDLLMEADSLYITNYKGQSISVYQLK